MKNKKTSPYHKYNKTPKRYSQLYQDWKNARNRNDNQLANQLAEKHTKYWLGPEPEEEKYY